jgi:hypothetical protein
MTIYQFDIDGNAKEPRQGHIRRLWGELGGQMTMDAFAHELIALGVYSDDEVRAYGVRKVGDEARRFLKQKDASGLPFACESAEVDEESGAPIWITRTLMGYEDYAHVIIKGAKALRDDHQSLVALQRECYRRYGRAPEVPDLVDDTEVEDVAD